MLAENLVKVVLDHVGPTELTDAAVREVPERASTLGA
jgi:hypothetical protein